MNRRKYILDFIGRNWYAKVHVNIIAKLKTITSYKHGLWRVNDKERYQRLVGRLVYLDC